MQRWLSSEVGFGLVTALYLLCFPYHPAIRSPNELCRLWQSRSLVEHQSLAINETLREYGMVGDLSCVARVEVSGVEQLVSCIAPLPPGARVIEARYFPSKAPMLSFLGAPVYAVLKALKTPVTDSAQVLFSRLAITVLPTLVMLVFLRRFLGQYLDEASRDLMVVVYALGTMAFSYSEQFLSHQLTAVLLFGSFYSAWKVQHREWGERRLVLAGFFAGSVVFTEYTGALGVLCLAAYVVAARFGQWSALARAAAFVSIGAAPWLLLLMAYHQVCFGHPLTSGYKFLNDAAYQGWHVGGFLGIRLPDLRAFVLSLISPLRGLFTLSPFLLLAFWGMAELKRRDRSLWVMVLCFMLGNAYFTSSFTYDSWGWTTGPRHLTPMLPFWMLPVGLALHRLKSSSVIGFSLAGGLCLSSVVAMSLVTQVNYVPNDVELVDASGVFHMSTSLFGLFVPLLGEDVWPVTWVATVVPNPASGMAVLALIALATGWVFAKLRSAQANALVIVVGAAVHLGALALVTEQHSGSVAAKTFLKQSWSAPNGQAFRWW
jgi:hypothetical protein